MAGARSDATAVDDCHWGSHSVIDEDEAGDPGSAFARAYDFFKHMTGVALISIGGVFAFMDREDSGLDTRRVVIVLACIGLSGITSLLMANMLASLEVRPVARDVMARRVRLGLVTSTFFIAAGLGAFVQTFSSAILK